MTVGAAHRRQSTVDERLRLDIERVLGYLDEQHADVQLGAFDRIVALALRSTTNPSTRVAPEETTGSSSIRLVPAAGVTPQRVSWACADRVPLGMVTLLVGQGGRGKSTEICRLTAGWSRGANKGDLAGNPVDVAIASSEDHRAAVLVPRLMAAGADLSRVHFVEAVFDDTAADIEIDGRVEALEHALTADGVRVRALCIDTLVSHIPGQHDTFKEQHVRRVLAPLAHMAERHGIAILATMHLNRRDQREVLTRISGSGGFGNLARSVLLFANNPDDADGPTRMLAHGKCNVGPIAPTLQVQIEGCVVVADDGSEIPTSRISLIGEAPDVAAGHLLGVEEGEDERSALDEAVSFLKDVLGDGPVHVTDVQRQARSAAISDATLRRAKGRLGVRSIRPDGFTKPWSWTLPEHRTCSSPRVPAPSADRARTADPEHVQAQSEEIDVVEELAL